MGNRIGVVRLSAGIGIFLWHVAIDGVNLTKVADSDKHFDFLIFSGKRPLPLTMKNGQNH